jgi:hypothetical protein
MSSLPGLTAQARSIGNCSSPQDCCNQIAALSARVSALEGDSGTARTALQKATDALGQAGIAKAQADTLTGEVDILQSGYAELAALVAGSYALARAAMAGLAALGPIIAALQAGLATLGASLAALSALIAPLIVAVAGIAALGLSVVAAQTLAQSAYDLANTALNIGVSAGAEASTAILRTRAAQAAADAANRIGAAAGDLARAAQSTADRAISAASGAQSTADRGLAAAGGAQSTADRAIGAAGAAQGTADRAISAAGTAQGTADNAQGSADRAQGSADGAQRTADTAINSAGTANTKADRAISSAGAANTKADRAIGTAGAANTKADRAIGTAGAANTKADRAIAAAGAANTKADGAIAAAGTAQATADRALAGTGQAISTSGQALGTAGVADNKSTEALDKANTALNRPQTINPAPPIIYPTPPAPPVTPSREAEILAALQGARADVLGIPGALIASTQFRNAAISAAAAGACQSSKPGGCPGGSADQNNQLKGIMDGISAAIGILNNQILLPMSNTVNTINTKLGSQIVGGLSAWSKGIAEVVNKSQILNVLTYISVLHNAYMLSNALSQTLFSAVGNSLSALGLKDTSVDPNGTPFNVGKIVGDWTETFFKSVFGVTTVNGIKADWKKYSRIYQAAAQVLSSLQSIGHSILGALEVVGSHVAKIGNALQKFRVVSEKAFTWMNPTPSFQNRFLTGLQTAQTVVSQVDQVAGETLSIQEQITQIQTNTTELQKTLKQEPNSAQATPTPEAVKVKEAAAEVKAASVSPAIPETAITKPD